MMRGRIGAQAFTVAAIIIGAYAGFKPNEKALGMEEKLLKMDSMKRE